jgi:hypothetical protein
MLNIRNGTAIQYAIGVPIPAPAKALKNHKISGWRTDFGDLNPSRGPISPFGRQMFPQKVIYQKKALISVYNL